MPPESLEVACAAASWAGTSLDSEQKSQLEVYHRWILQEAIRAGGLGPNEADKVWSRHIADSLLFGVGLTSATSAVDIGSGVGLPGIPLAVAHPNIGFTLVDRSGRRCDLLGRALAILRIENCTVVQGDVTTIRSTFDAVVTRAAIPLQDVMIHVKRLLEPGGSAVVGLSRSRPIDDAAIQRAMAQTPGLCAELVTVPADILDTTTFLLRIEAT